MAWYIGSANKGETPNRSTMPDSLCQEPAEEMGAAALMKAMLADNQNCDTSYRYEQLTYAQWREISRMQRT